METQRALKRVTIGKSLDSVRRKMREADDENGPGDQCPCDALEITVCFVRVLHSVEGIEWQLKWNLKILFSRTDARRCGIPGIRSWRPGRRKIGKYTTQQWRGGYAKCARAERDDCDPEKKNGKRR
jgi:hypothetical protein